MGTNYPLLLVLAGIAAILFGLAADLFGVGGKAGLGPRQTLFVQGGTLLTVAALLVDGTIGRRSASAWIRERFADPARLGRFLLVAAQLGVLVLVTRRLEIENQALYDNILLLVFFGFLIHDFLPEPWRLPFFLLLSLGGFSGVLGPANAAWLVAIGLLLIGISRLPVAFGARVLLLLLAGGALALLRAGFVPSPLPAVIWPILGSIFMFRMIAYMYDLRHAKERPGAMRTLAYFFLLPNVVFPFFPVVDFSTFCRSDGGGDRIAVYQKGVAWVFRGVVQLVLYRLVYHHLVIAPEDAVTIGSLARYLSVNFLLYLRISGMFHMIVGMLHLFGFDLPETNHLYCLSSSFTDFWRRINIYWKDFMQKVFFFPLFFRLRGRGMTMGLVVSTLAVFLVTWAFHAWQWFWIRGGYLFTAPDILFWTILGLLVVANMLIESKFGRRRSLERRAWGATVVLTTGLRTVGTFAAVCVIWSLWTAESIPAWLALWGGIRVTAAGLLGAGVVALVASVAAGLLSGRLSVPEVPGKGTDAAVPFGRYAMRTGLAILLLYAAASPAVEARLGPRAQRFVRDLRSSRLSKQDEALLVRGYYEDLTNVNRFNSRLWEVYSKRPDEWPNLWDIGAVRPTGDFLRYELRPSLDVVFKDRRFRTNRWGMRDHDYTLDPPPGVFRIAITGGSHAMGSGVADDETFEARLETQLNAEAGEGAPRYEILNFAVDGYNALQELVVFDEKVFEFQPDLCIYVAHTREDRKALRFLAERALSGIEIPYEPLARIIGESGIDAGMSKDLAVRSLRPYGEQVTAWLYGRIVAECRERGIPAVWVFLPDEVGSTYGEEVERNTAYADEAGFTVIDLSDVYEGRDPEALKVAPWDFHPNEKGHALIAERLYGILRDPGAGLIQPR